MGIIMKGDESSKERGMEIIKGCFIFGILLSLSPSIVSFLTNQNITNLSSSPYLPSGLGAILEKIILMVQTIGAVAILFGLIYGGYQYGKYNNYEIKLLNFFTLLFALSLNKIDWLIMPMIFIYCIFLFMDLYSTKEFYKTKEEKNPIMNFLLKKYNFIKASIILILLWEIPGIIIVTYAISIIINNFSLVTTLISISIGHLIAFIYNRR
jgi:hypothetical protein